LAFPIHPFPLRLLAFLLGISSLASFLRHLGRDWRQSRFDTFACRNTDDVLTRFERGTVRAGDGWFASNRKSVFMSGNSGFLNQGHFLNGLFLLVAVVAASARLEGTEFILDFALCVVECECAFAAGSNFLLVVPFLVAFVFVRLALRDGRRESTSAVTCRAFACWAVEPPYSSSGGRPDNVTPTFVVPKSEEENKEE
jgi:hypothetical protein